MPVRSLNTSVIKWPGLQTVDRAARGWANRQASLHPRIERAAYFGSYARRDWGVGSDLDLLLIVSESPLPFEMRASQFDTTPLPVPVDLLVYTSGEWQQMIEGAGSFIRRLQAEAVWIYPAQIT